MSLDKAYQPSAIETKWYEQWERAGYFSPDENLSDPYCIMIPPPNVTGSLHMGHAFQDTIMDALIRYNRMLGKSTLWQPGTDHAGIATQMVVERLINAEGKTRHDYGREAFTDRVWKWKEESGGRITKQLRRMGASPDWQHERFTMDEGLSDAVTTVFVQLYEMGIIYRGKRLVNWDPVLHTALSDLEVISEEEKSHLWHLRYPLSDGSGHVIVATTRPETMLGDSAVAVHPDDERFKHLVGKTVDLPLTGRQIPIVADEHADPEKGSGCVKITPAHDFNDYQVWQRHKDSPAMQGQFAGGLINIFDKHARVRENDDDGNDIIPSQFIGMSREDARLAIINAFQELDLVERIEPHLLMIPRGDRSSSVVEPLLTDQWFVDLTTETQADGRPGGKSVITTPSIDVVKNGQIKFVPENWSKTYFGWLNDIQDWCISRQIWWGHRIPAWYDEDGNIFVGKDEQAVREKYKLAENHVINQDDDVLDTWFSSALWPFSTLGWPEQTERLDKFYPTSVLVTGFDIIFFWVARMIMFGVTFMKEVPFKEVYIHGLVRDMHGQKMSKSKGNVLDPLDIIDGIDLESLVKKRTTGLMRPEQAPEIEKQTREDFPEGINSYGTDALRFTFAALASNGRDVNFDLARTEGYQNFCNKIWNAARYVVMMNDDAVEATAFNDSQRNLIDRWIISELQLTEAEVNKQIQAYRFDLVAKALHEFIWDKYCSWYLEFSKTVLKSTDTSEQQKAACLATLNGVFEASLRLIHPIMPFISEEIWQVIAPLANKQGDTIMNQAYPIADMSRYDEHACNEIAWVQSAIQGIRKAKAELNVAPGKKVPVIMVGLNQAERDDLPAQLAVIKSLARVEDINLAPSDEGLDSHVMVLADAVKIYIDFSGAIDVEAERNRLNKDIANARNEITKLTSKLGNQGFVSKAPVAVVEGERQRLSKMQASLKEFEQQLSRL